MGTKQQQRFWAKTLEAVAESTAMRLSTKEHLFYWPRNRNGLRVQSRWLPYYVTRNCHMSDRKTHERSGHKRWIMDRFKSSFWLKQGFWKVFNQANCWKTMEYWRNRLESGSFPDPWILRSHPPFFQSTSARIGGFLDDGFKLVQMMTGSVLRNSTFLGLLTQMIC